MRRLQQLTVYLQSASARAWIHFRERPPFQWMGSLGVGAGLVYLRTGAFLDPVRKEPWFQAIERDLKYAD